MSVEFEENNFNQQNQYSVQPRGFVGWLIGKGFAKDEAGANKIQIGIAIAFFALSIYFFVS